MIIFFMIHLLKCSFYYFKIIVLFSPLGEYGAAGRDVPCDLFSPSGEYGVAGRDVPCVFVLLL